MATFEITQVPASEIEDGARAEFKGFVRWPEHVNHDPQGENLVDENGNTVMLEFEVDVYMPTDETARQTAMQAYADDYEQGYWQSVSEGHLTTPSDDTM